MRTLPKLAVALGCLGLLSSTAGPVQAQQAGPTVSIKDFVYSPADVAVQAGQAITIANQDGFPHTVTAGTARSTLTSPPTAL